MRKGFTLIELLIVIAVLAILATVVVLVINPAQLLREARDGQRVNDLASIRDAISLYLIVDTTPDLAAGAGTCGTNCFTATDMTGTDCDGRHAGLVESLRAGLRGVDGTGWVPVDFTQILSSSPFSVLPIDPSGTVVAGTDNDLVYSYACTASNTFELNAVMESIRFANTGAGDVESVDGGDNADVYEVGTAIGLSL